jgi:hypothetical protein
VNSYQCFSIYSTNISCADALDLLIEDAQNEANSIFEEEADQCSITQSMQAAARSPTQLFNLNVGLLNTNPLSKSFSNYTLASLDKVVDLTDNEPVPNDVNTWNKWFGSLSCLQLTPNTAYNAVSNQIANDIINIEASLATLYNTFHVKPVSNEASRRTIIDVFLNTVGQHYKTTSSSAVIFIEGHSPDTTGTVNISEPIKQCIEWTFSRSKRLHWCKINRAFGFRKTGLYALCTAKFFVFY